MRLPHTAFTDTMFAGTPSGSGNKCAQVYATSFGWARAHPMTRKGDAHETLSLLFHRDGVPPTMVLDGSKEQNKGDFMMNCVRQIATLDRLSPTPRGSRLLRVVSAN